MFDSLELTGRTGRIVQIWTISKEVKRSNWISSSFNSPTKLLPWDQSEIKLTIKRHRTVWTNQTDCCQVSGCLRQAYNSPRNTRRDARSSLLEANYVIMIILMWPIERHHCNCNGKLYRTFSVFTQSTRCCSQAHWVCRQTDERDHTIRSYCFRYLSAMVFNKHCLSPEVLNTKRNRLGLVLKLATWRVFNNN